MSTGNVIQSNTVKCPSCSTRFENNVVNGIALVDLVGRIDSRKKMYCRLTLDSIERLEESRNLSVATIKKIILDNLNDYNRDVQTMLGWGLDVE